MNPTALLRAALGTAIVLSTPLTPCAHAASVPYRPGDELTGGGYFTAPRYLAHPGDYELHLEPTVLVDAQPYLPPARILGQVGFHYQALDNLELEAVLGAVTLVGARGPLYQSKDAAIGWAAHYRADSFTRPSYDPGTSPVAYLLPIPGIEEAHGGQIRLDTMRVFGPLVFYAAPGFREMSNRTSAGAEVGIDLDLDRLIIGYGGTFYQNFYNPFGLSSPINPFESEHTLGARYILNDRTYVHGTYFFIPADTYADRVQAIVAGVGFQFGP